MSWASESLSARRRCLKGVDVLFSTSVSLLMLPNTFERYHDSPNPALSSLPRYGYCPPWHDSSRQATVPVPRATLCQSYLPAGLELGCRTFLSCISKGF